MSPLDQKQKDALKRLSTSGLVYGDKMLGRGEEQVFVKTYIDKTAPVTEKTEIIRNKVKELLLIDQADAQILMSNSEFAAIIQETQNEYAQVEKEAAVSGVRKIWHDFTRSNRRRVASVKDARSKLEFQQQREIDQDMITEAHGALDLMFGQAKARHYGKGYESFDRKTDMIEEGSSYDYFGSRADLLCFDIDLDVTSTSLNKQARINLGLSETSTDNAYRDIGRSVTPIRELQPQGSQKNATLAVTEQAIKDVSVLVGDGSKIESLKSVDDKRLMEAYTSVRQICVDFSDEVNLMFRNPQYADLYKGKGTLKQICEHMDLMRKVSKKSQPIIVFLEKMMVQKGMYTKLFTLLTDAQKEEIRSMRAMCQAIYTYEKYYLVETARDFEKKFNAGEAPKWEEYRPFTDVVREIYTEYQQQEASYKPYVEQQKTTETSSQS